VREQTTGQAGGDGKEGAKKDDSGGSKPNAAIAAIDAILRAFSKNDPQRASEILRNFPAGGDVAADHPAWRDVMVALAIHVMPAAQASACDDVDSRHAVELASCGNFCRALARAAGENAENVIFGSLLSDFAIDAALAGIAGGPRDEVAHRAADALLGAQASNMDIDPGPIGRLTRWVGRWSESRAQKAMSRWTEGHVEQSGPSGQRAAIERLARGLATLEANGVASPAVRAGALEERLQALSLSRRVPPWAMAVRLLALAESMPPESFDAKGWGALAELAAGAATRPLAGSSGAKEPLEELARRCRAAGEARAIAEAIGATGAQAGSGEGASAEGLAEASDAAKRGALRV
jgi:hypothetical protein